MAKYKPGQRCLDVTVDKPCEIVNILRDGPNHVVYVAAFSLSDGRYDLSVEEGDLVPLDD